MIGTGFYIWKLKSVLPIDRLIESLKRANANWVWIKVADGVSKYNLVPDDSGLIDVIEALKSAGIHVGGWHFIYPNPVMSPGAQAGVAGERYQKLGLESWSIDAEQVSSVRAYWKFLADGSLNPYRKTSAKIYMQQIRGAGVPQKHPVAVSTYRYPDYHLEFPFSQFVNSENNDIIAQQMYWIGSHNPREQLLRSVEQYNKTVRAGLPPLPFVPIGAAFGVGSWVPADKELVEFIDAAKEIGAKAWGFWSLDWTLANKPEWLDVIGGNSSPPPPPPPPPPGNVTKVEIVGLDPDETLRMRNSIFGTVVGMTWNGAQFEVEGEDKDSQGRVWYQVGKSIWIASWYTKVIG